MGQANDQTECDQLRRLVADLRATNDALGRHAAEQESLARLRGAEVAKWADEAGVAKGENYRLRAALKEALDLAERFAVQVEEETYFADGGSETKRRIAELRKEFGL